MRQLSRLMVVFTYMCCMLSCVDHRETITDEYFIHNDLDKAVSLEFSRLVAWDTCPTGTFIRVMYDSVCKELPAHKTIRLHPVVREYKIPSTHKVQAGYLLGAVTKLVVNTDTIVWESKYGHMFESDSIWSIYNSKNWETVKDKELPNTYYQTFRITPYQLERSLQ